MFETDSKTFETVSKTFGMLSKADPSSFSELAQNQKPKTMKIFRKTLFIAACIGLLAACEKSDHFWGDDPLGNAHKKCAIKSMVTVPLKADFSVVPEAFIPDNTHPEYSTRLIMVGEGTMSHFGKMTTRMVFYGNMVPVGPYGHGTGTFIAANGDELYFEFDEGLIILNEEDNAGFYLTRFNDEMFFTGGSGRFKGASGSLWSNAFVHYLDPEVEGDYWHTDFFSYGTLIMAKGK